MGAVAQPERRGWWGTLRRLPLWQPLRVRDFRLFWSGQSISILGDQFYFVALPWLTLQLTGSALALGTVLLAGAVPRSVLILLGGAFADRASARLLILGSDAVRGLLVGVLAALVLTDHAQLWELYLLSFLFGVIDAIFYPAYDSITPALLDEERLAAGNALLQGSAQLTVFLGPALAGVIIATLGTAAGNGSAFAVDAASFFVAALAMLLMRGGNRQVSAEGKSQEGVEETATNLLAEIKEGVSYVWHDRVLRALLLVIVAASFAVNGPVTVGLAALAHNRFGSAAAFGTMLAAYGLGALAGTVVAGSMGTVRHRGALLIGLGGAFSVGVILVGLSPNVLVASAVLLVLGLAEGVFGVALITWIQSQTASAMLGRVMSLLALASFGLVPLSLAVSGVVAQLGVTLLFVLAGVLMGAVTLGIAASRTIRTFD